MSLEKPAGLQVFYGLVESDLHRESDSKPISAARVPELTLNHDPAPTVQSISPVSARFRNTAAACSDVTNPGSPGFLAR